MHTAKFQVYSAFAIALFALLWGAWFVLGAYITVPQATKIRLTGVDLAVDTQSDLGESPFRFDRFQPVVQGSQAPETLAFAEPDEPKSEFVSSAIIGGAGKVTGVVTESNTPVEGAVVILEKDSSAGAVQIQTISDANGVYSFDGVVGGRYRVRSYVPFQLASVDVESFFIEQPSGGESRLPWKVETRIEPLEANLRVQKANSGVLVETSAADVIYPETPAQVIVSVSTTQVDANGVIQVVPVDGAGLTLEAVGGYTPTAFPEAVQKVTDARGLATFEYSCQVLGLGSASVDVEGSYNVIAPGSPATQEFSITKLVRLPDCVEFVANVSEEVAPEPEVQP